MPILFSAVARYKTVLTKYASCEGNFTEILEEMLSKIPPKNEKMTYSHGRYLINYICNQNGYFYFCITVKAATYDGSEHTVFKSDRRTERVALVMDSRYLSCQRSRAFLFLNEITRKFQPRHREFHDVLAEEMRRFSEDYSTIVIRKGDLDELNNIGVGDSDTILGEKILFVKNSENLKFSKLCKVDATPQQVMYIGEKSKYSFKFYIIALAVILVVMWWIISKIGIVSFIILVCFSVFSILRLSNIIKIKF